MPRRCSGNSARPENPEDPEDPEDPESGKNGEDPEDGEEAPPGDTELVSRMRGGNTTAYEEFRRRHYDAVRRYTGHCCRTAAAADALADEVFARTLLTVRDGTGPDTAMRVHLLTVVRQVAAAWGRTACWEQLAEEFAVFAVAADSPGSGESFESDADVRAMWRAERSTVVDAFRCLPERWQVVLWHTVVENEPPRGAAPLLGLTAPAAERLARRAEEGLRQAYLHAHIGRARAAGGDCAHHVDRLGAYTRRSRRTRPGRGLHRHLEQCADCRSAARGAGDVRERLRLLLPVAVMGWGAAEYAAHPRCPARSAYSAHSAAGEHGVRRAGPYPRPAETAGAAGYAVVSALGDGAVPGSVGEAGPAGSTWPARAARGEGQAGRRCLLDAPAGRSGADGTSVSDGLCATAKAGVTAGVMAAAVATALTLALVGDGQRPRGPQPGAGSPGPAATLPDTADGAGTGAEVKGSRLRDLEVADAEPAVGTAVTGPGHRAGPSGRTDRPGGPAGDASVPPAAPGVPGGGVVPDVPESVRPDVGSPLTSPPSTPPPAVRPPAARSGPTVHRLEQLYRDGSGAGGPDVRRGESGWLWPRSHLYVDGRDRGPGATVRAGSSVVVEVGGACTVFEALVGVDDLTLGRGAVRFAVHADGVRLWRSGLLRRGDAPVPVRVPLTGRRTVRLVVEARTVVDQTVLADWVRARFGCR
ncbi:NPCBM/NEW2 domain-containing protein [Streptomyces sp. TRM 70361]|uniref:NPCBM/NEW2 domain-containing protein n=1 Tax=Streptomyces sp. TRM 70361 TaxID=3116553 RepID=UPI002E7C047B|nr:NPCBM/NEW2 domain-containing protein [Streptomyces sp. TRM 70361]MEE1941635.1 NPCBM/NEW2 domain-containing protein [Streptomyces sp. TRM 70361]